MSPVLLNLSTGAVADVLQAMDEVQKGCAWACQEGKLELLKTLFDRGAELGVSELFLATAGGHVDVVNFLLDRQNADIIHACDDEVLRLSVGNGHTEIVRLLLDRGADVHANDDEALRIAAGRGNTNVVKLLLDRGADVHAKDDEALRWAAENGHTETARIMP
jgi:ankyrin repeat protein